MALPKHCPQCASGQLRVVELRPGETVVRCENCLHLIELERPEVDPEQVKQDLVLLIGEIREAKGAAPPAQVEVPRLAIAILVVGGALLALLWWLQAPSPDGATPPGEKVPVEVVSPLMPE
ncbi:MAG: hypothetical protein JXX28_08800 [Deltaproteobacteria bacterium]|nr:hypothetical protein [Deltaproteobacteria bacterium]